MEICDFSTVNYFYCLHLRDISEFSSFQLIIILFFFDRRYYFDRGFVGAIKLSPVSKRGGFVAVGILYKCNWFLVFGLESIRRPLEFSYYSKTLGISILTSR